MTDTTDKRSLLLELPQELRQKVLLMLTEDEKVPKSAVDYRYRNPCKVVEDWCSGKKFGREGVLDCTHMDAGFWQKMVRLVFDPVYMRDKKSPVWTTMPTKRSNDTRDWTWRRIFEVLCRMAFANQETNNEWLYQEGLGPGARIDGTAIFIVSQQDLYWRRTESVRMFFPPSSAAKDRHEWIDALVHDIVSVLLFFGADVTRHFNEEDRKRYVWGLSDEAACCVLGSACAHRYAHVVRLVLAQPTALPASEVLDRSPTWRKLPYWLVRGATQTGFFEHSDDDVRNVIRIMEMLSQQTLSDGTQYGYVTFLNEGGEYDALAHACTRMYMSERGRCALVKYLVTQLHYKAMSEVLPFPMGSTSTDGPAAFAMLLRMGRCERLDEDWTDRDSALAYLVEQTNLELPDNSLHSALWKPMQMTNFENGLVDNTWPGPTLPFCMLFQPPVNMARKVSPTHVQQAIDFYERMNVEREANGDARLEVLNWKPHDEGMTPLYYAVLGESYDVLETLVRAGADLNVRTNNEYRFSLLDMAAQFNKFHEFNMLLYLNQKYNNNSADWILDRAPDDTVTGVGTIGAKLPKWREAVKSHHDSNQRVMDWLESNSRSSKA